MEKRNYIDEAEISPKNVWVPSAAGQAFEISPKIGWLPSAAGEAFEISALPSMSLLQPHHFKLSVVECCQLSTGPVAFLTLKPCVVKTFSSWPHSRLLYDVLAYQK